MSANDKIAALEWLDLLAAVPTPGGSAHKHARTIKAMLKEDADNIEALRKQSRGHFEAMTAVLRDGIEAILPETAPKKAN